MPNSLWPVDGPHIISVKVQAEDIDGIGHSNNSRYIAWCEQAAWSHSQELGLGIDDYQRLDRAMIIQRAEYDYLAATFAGEQLNIATWLADARGTRMTRRFQIQRAQDGLAVLNAAWYLVCVELHSGKPKKLPPEFRDVYLPAIRQ